MYKEEKMLHTMPDVLFEVVISGDKGKFFLSKSRIKGEKSYISNYYLSNFLKLTNRNHPFFAL